MYNYRAEKDNTKGLHRNIASIGVTKDEEVVIFFDDMSHTYINRNNVKKIIKEILMINYDEEE